MSVRRSLTMTASLLAGSLLLNVLLVSCAAESTGPAGADTEILQRLDAVTARLAAIEAKLDSASVRTATRFDSLQTVVTAAIAGDPTLTTLQAAQLDSVVALASFIANDAASGGLEFCGNIEFGVEGTGLTKAEAKGEGAGHLGAWAGTGGFAGAKLEFAREYGIEVKVGVPLSFGGCIPIGGGDPPSRALRASLRAADGGPRLETSLTTLASQLGINETRINTAINTIGTAIQSPASLRVQDAVSLLPLPANLSGKLSDVTGTLSSELEAKAQEALGALCSANWGSRIGPPIQTACTSISSGSFNIGGFVSMAQDFPVVQQGVTLLTNRMQIFCGRVNSIGNTSLTIPNPLNIGPEPLFGPQRLFPNYTNVSC